ncbi:F-box/LRR-repeat protein 12-like [Tachypleus tridentatus]|uniref:F-box/LRR-repeat protein 12-like n=1 Tax=Tachypleus tridentatus TaxID=6853 RepID=UPI003FD3435E
MKKCIRWRFGSGGEISKSMLWCSKLLRRTACRKQTLTINSLPDSILVYLFSFLTFLELCNVSRVCKQWYILSKDFSLRRVIELREHSITTSQVKQLIYYHFNSFLVELHLRGQSRSLWLTPFTPKILAKLQKFSPNLRCLIMEDFNFRSLTSEKCVKLQDFPLTLHHLSIRNSIIDRSVFFYTNIGKPVTFDLEILDLGRCVYLADGNIHQWPNLPQLKELFLEGCPFIDKHLLESIMGLQRTLKSA